MLEPVTNIDTCSALRTCCASLILLTTVQKQQTNTHVDKQCKQERIVEDPRLRCCKLEHRVPDCPSQDIRAQPIPVLLAAASTLHADIVKNISASGHPSHYSYAVGGVGRTDAPKQPRPRP